MTNITLTENEIDDLNGIAYHEFTPVNGAKPEDASEAITFCWAEDFSKKLSASQVKGVLSSLVKKDLIEIDDMYSDKNNTVQFTEAGFEIWQGNNKPQ